MTAKPYILALAATTTIPSILYLSVRCFSIFGSNIRALFWHVRRGSVALAVHVLVGMAVLVAMPFLGWLCVPLQENNQSTVEQHRTILRIITVALLFVNGSVLVLLPNPARYKEYKTTQRIFVKSLSFSYASALQFIAMASSTIAFLVDDGISASAASLLSCTSYAASVFICGCEMKNIAWENFNVAKFLFPRLGKGPKTKSKIISNGVKSPENLQGGFAPVFFAGVLAMTQPLMHLRTQLLPKLLPPPETMLKDFFVISVLYQVLVMSAGFFSLVQLDPAKTSETHFKFDVFLGQILPACVVLLGPYWVKEAGFMWQWLLWTS